MVLAEVSDDEFKCFRNATTHVVRDCNNHLHVTPTSTLTEQGHSLKRKPQMADRTMQCESCPYSTKHRHDYSRHRARHVTARFSCPECNMPFATMGHVNGHRRSVHGLVKNEVKLKKILSCNECPYTTVRSSDMARHRRRHNECALNCGICNWPFTSFSHLDLHMRQKHTESEDGIDTPFLSNEWKRFQASRKKNKDNQEHREKPGNKDNRSQGHCIADYETEFTQIKSAAPEKIKQNEETPLLVIGGTERKSSKENKRKSSCDTEKLTSEKKCRRSEVVPEMHRNRKKTTRSVKCAFCDYKATSFKNLKTHLEGDCDVEAECNDILSNESSRNANYVTSSPGDGKDETDTDDTDAQEVDNDMFDDAVSAIHDDNEDGGTDYDNSSKHESVNAYSCSNTSIGTDDTRGVENEDKDEDQYDQYSEEDQEIDKDVGDVRKRRRDVELSSDVNTFVLELAQNPFSCSLCGLRFAEVSVLQKHVQAHLNDLINNKSSGVTSRACQTLGSGFHSTGTEEKSTQTLTSNENILEKRLISLAHDDKSSDRKSPPADVEQTESLTGRMSKEYFQRTRCCYEVRTLAWSGKGTRRYYECMICDKGNKFDCTEDVRKHFSEKHAKLRQKICSSCSYCSKPFP